MIVRSLRRKTASFSQLADYIAKGCVKGSILIRNLYASGDDLAEIAAEFTANDQLLPERRNGNRLYHEIIALDPAAKLSPRQATCILQDLAETYLAMRGPHQLVFGAAHFDKDHPHFHLMISANGAGERTPLRLRRDRFTAILKRLEAYRMETYPALGQRVLYGKPEGRENRQADSRYAQSGKAAIRASLTLALGAGSRADFETALRTENLRLYRRGKHTGVITPKGRKYRLSTLGVAETYQAAEAHWGEVSGRLERLRSIRAQKQQRPALAADSALTLEKGAGRDSGQTPHTAWPSSDPFADRPNNGASPF